MRYCLNQSPRKLCEAVEAVIPAEMPRLIRRPYNHFQPTMTSWWLVPSVELPFFKFGKFSFSWDERVRTTIASGLYLSKGLDPSLASVYPSKKGRRLIMTDDWAWHKFTADCRSGAVGAAIHTAALNSATYFAASIEAGYIDDPGLFDPQLEHPELESCILEYDASTKTMRPVAAKRSAALCLKSLNKAMSLAAFCQALTHLGRENFLWMNVSLAAHYGVIENSSHQKEVAGAEAIWRHSLTPFLPWIG